MPHYVKNRTHEKCFKEKLVETKIRIGQPFTSGSDWPMEAGFPTEALAVLRYMAGERETLPHMRQDTLRKIQRRMKTLVLLAMREELKGRISKIQLEDLVHD